MACCCAVTIIAKFIGANGASNLGMTAARKWSHPVSSTRSRDHDAISCTTSKTW